MNMGALSVCIVTLYSLMECKIGTSVHREHWNFPVFRNQLGSGTSMSFTPSLFVYALPNSGFSHKNVCSKYGCFVLGFNNFWFGAAYTCHEQPILHAHRCHVQPTLHAHRHI